MHTSEVTASQQAWQRSLPVVNQVADVAEVFGKEQVAGPCSILKLQLVRADVEPQPVAPLEDWTLLPGKRQP